MSDRHGFLYNVLNYPFLFNLVRSVLDGGQVRFVGKVVKELHPASVLDVACGTGGFSRVTEGLYTGIDYNSRFIAHAKKRYVSGNKTFIVGDAQDLTGETMYDLALLINALHHFSDDESKTILAGLMRVSKRLLVVDLIPMSNPLSKLLYRIDRGINVRTLNTQIQLIEASGCVIERYRAFMTFPMLYRHSLLVCSDTKRKGNPCHH